MDYLINRWAREIPLLLVGLLVLLPLMYWHGRKRWLRGWTEDAVMTVGFCAFVSVVAVVAIYKGFFRG